ncbi:MAG: PKD repeat protein [Sphingobacteriales bacterium]|jgi:PKD repeat protein
MKHLSSFLLAAMFFSAGSAIAQEAVIPCYTTEQTEINFKENPEYKENRDALEQFTLQYLENRKVTSQTHEDTVYIPIVFHIYHQYGPEAISRAQIEDQVRIINEDFRRINPDTTDTDERWRAVASDTYIEFRLARKDPNGERTDGRVMVPTSATDFNNQPDRTDKAISVWPQTSYFNVWVVRNIGASGGGGVILGYAQFPGTGADATYGIVIRADVTGSIEFGTAFDNQGRTLVHEIGHCLNLRHIWGDGGCGASDGVNDTPDASASSSGCPTNKQTCGTFDMTDNYMDYTNGSCQNMFTHGQTDRMHAALKAGGNKIDRLITPENAEVTGILDTNSYVIMPYADFWQNYRTACEGEPIKFTDFTWNGIPDAWEWTFSNEDTTIISTEQNPTMTFTMGGEFDVKLVVSNATGSDSLTREAWVRVIPENGDLQGYVQQGFEYENFTDSNWVIVPDKDGRAFEITYDASYQGAASLVYNQPNGNASGKNPELISPAVDISNMNEPVLRFRLAYARRNNSSSDRLVVFTSTNCGKLWKFKFSKFGSGMETTDGPQSGAYFPGSADEWVEHEISLSSIDDATNAMFKFQITTGGGNNLYFDNIQIVDNNPSTGVTEKSGVSFKVSPNPINNNFNISVSNSALASTLEVMDITGKIVKAVILDSSSSSFNFNGNNLFPAKGVYLLKLTSEHGILIEKVIFQ